MSLFNTTSSRREYKFWIPKPDNKNTLFVYKMMNKPQRKDLSACNVSIVNSVTVGEIPTFVEQAPAFHDGRLYYRLTESLPTFYYNKYYTTLNDNYYHHTLISGSCYGLYILYCGEPGKCYVGMTSKQTFSERWDKHIDDLKHNRHHCHRMQTAFNKTGVCMPMVFAAYISDTDEHYRQIKDYETVLIKQLWQNNYNSRKF